MKLVTAEMVSSEQVAELLSKASEQRSTSAGELKARWLDTPEGTVVLVEGLNGQSLCFTRPSP